MKRKNKQKIQSNETWGGKVGLIRRENFRINIYNAIINKLNNEMHRA